MGKFFMECSSSGYLFLLLACAVLVCSEASPSDSIMGDQSLKDGQTIVSSRGTFELGFFSPSKSSLRRYVGIWYKNIPNITVVWVANRDFPLYNTTGSLKIVDQRTLVIVDSDSNQTVWSSNSTGTIAGNAVAQLLDSGNLVLRPENDTDPMSYIWQSFDYPGDTLLPGMKYGIDLVTGLNRELTSWRSPEDPSRGEYSNRMDRRGVPEFYLWKGSNIQFRSGPWNGMRFSGMPNLKPNPIYNFRFVFSDKEVYYTFNLTDSSVISRMVMSSDGVLQRFIYISRTKGWNLYLTAQMDNCERYNLCGAYGSCDINNSPACGCLKAFEPRFPDYWATSDWSGGCVRKKILNCTEGEGFLKYSGMKLPDTRGSWYNQTMSLEECSRVCRDNCSCTAYASMDIRDGGSGCILWFGDLIDLRNYNENGQDIYIRLAASEIESSKSSKGKTRTKLIVIPVVAAASGFLLFVVLKCRRKRSKIEAIIPQSPEQDNSDVSEKGELELPLFDFATIIMATGNFSPGNKIGQGGFGSVYKGTLSDGQAIAVKRLSKRSRQGLDEFRNEVLCISMLQHRNLVKLLGCCIQEGERMLIYEFMPNKSLDFIIFDQRLAAILDWSKRFQIINGIARGLLYLHQDSTLRIIHRDLKASNILLDQDMNPKISDFGMARSFTGEESTEGKTNRVVGTYGYMSPEYAIDGQFSVKSDVFSFGVLVLEIVSGKKNRRFRHPDHKLNLLGHAWWLYKEMKLQELMDESIRESCNRVELLRTVLVALLCVQQSPEDRPNMSKVVLMLSSDISLPQPKEPGFFNERDLSDTEYSTTKKEISTTHNGMTMTVLDGR
ncbi:hypothetical protein SAY86_028437 [Trapa natans]|uniref:Receptor-like serine/threonine-protein kinase n=1 Tax=Trapa natans TaxID=22666 RepID=A0AAN7RE49_TRANT|nr:hypothetical protein SAY86_028437 [Trapa natans]